MRAPAPGDDDPEYVDLSVEEPVGAEVAEPRPLAPSDPVPVFRVDLKVLDGAAPGLFEVADPGTGRHFTLYEFELSIARMLDGRRHASDVIESGVRLGIPVDLAGLDKFVRQLWRYGFLAPPGAPPPPDEEGAWPDREKWDEATRALFQSALRLVRQGRPQDAASYLHAVLDADPGNAEATRLLEAIDRGETRAAGPIGAREPAPAPPAPPRRRRALAAAAAGALLAAVAAVLLLPALRRSPPAQLPVPPEPPPAAPLAPPPKPAAPAPAPTWRTAPVQRREHPALGELASPGDGVVAWAAKEGAPVKTGQRVGALRIAAGAPAPADPAAAARIRELEALAAQDPVYRDFLEKERRAQQGRRGASPRLVPLVAPEGGAFAPTAADGARVARGDALGAIVDPDVWLVDAFVDGPPPAADAACELRGDAAADRLPCRLDAARPQEGGARLLVTVRASDAPWLAAARSLRVRVAPAGTAPEPAPPAPPPEPKETP